MKNIRVEEDSSSKTEISEAPLYRFRENKKDGDISRSFGTKIAGLGILQDFTEDWEQYIQLLANLKIPNILQREDDAPEEFNRRELEFLETLQNIINKRAVT